MTTPPRRTVLCIGLDAATCVSLLRVCRPRQLDLVQLPWGPRAAELSAHFPLAAIVASYPATSGDFGSFLRALRSPTSPSPRSSMVLVARTDARSAASLFLGRGVNRVHAADDPIEALAQSLLELCDVAPRVTVKGTARLRAQLERAPYGTVCDVENISTSGMLLRGWVTFAVGQIFDFDLKLPSIRSAIRGQAVVARLTDLSREKFNGLGVRFTRIQKADHDRLAALVCDQPG